MASNALVHPGVQVQSEAGGCTANFVFTDLNESKIYIGTASHCVLARGNEPPINDSDECRNLPSPQANPDRRAFFGSNLSFPDEFGKSVATGHYVYISMLAMRDANETHQATCVLNDFALIEIDPQFLAIVNPSIETWGGPAGFATPNVADGAKVYTVGGTWIRDGVERELGLPLVVERTRPREGYLATSMSEATGKPREMAVDAYFVGGCLPGDSGSPVLSDTGQIFGVVTAIDTGRGASCEIVLLAPMLAYMETHGGPRVKMHVGTEAFQRGILPP